MHASGQSGSRTRTRQTRRIVAYSDGETPKEIPKETQEEAPQEDTGEKETEVWRR